MKQLLSNLIILCLSGVINSSAAGLIVRYQIHPADVTELNKLAAAVGITGKSGWPVSGEELTSAPSGFGLYFMAKDTLKSKQGTDDKWVIRYKVTQISLMGQGLTGTLPSLSFSELQEFKLSNNNLTGTIPTFDFPKCTAIHLSQNKLTGSVPNISLPLLQDLLLWRNNLTGTIPNLSMPNLLNLELTENNLEGSIPTFNLPKLRNLNLATNKLTGSIPNFNMPDMRYFNLYQNKLTGEIPNFNFPNAIDIRLYENNLTGPIPNFNTPKLSNLALGVNGLTGTIPRFNFPDLLLLNLKDNKLEGTFDNSGLPRLIDVYLQNNNISGLTHLKQFSPQLWYVDVSGNRLTFEDLEPNMDLNISTFTYKTQQKVELYKLQTGNEIVLYVTVGGTKNRYVWRKIKDGQNTVVTGATKDTLKTAFEAGASYYCLISSTLVTGMTLTSNQDEIKSCISFGLLEFCLQGGVWQKKENNIVSANGRVYLNNSIMFDGSMTLDTLNVAMQATGVFYVKNIPLPGGGTGDYIVSQGEHNLKLLGKDGIITNFLNSKLEKTAMLFGYPLKIDNLQFVKKKDTVGVRLACSVKIPQLSAECEYYYLGTDIALNNLLITNAGILLRGFNVENLGLFKKGYCLKKLTYDYNYEKDILTGGMIASLPFISNAGGGFRFRKGNLDSVAWIFESSLIKVPISPPSTFSVKGFYGHIAGLAQPFKPFETAVIDIRMGGIFTDFLSDNIYRVTAEGRTIWPKIFEVAGTGELLRPSVLNLPFQLAGGVKLSYNAPDKLVKINLNGNFGTLDKQTWLMEVTGTFNLNHRNEKTEMDGSFGGMISLPKLYNGFPFDWMANYIDFPVKLGTANAVFNENLDIAHGVLYFKPFSNIQYDINYIIDMSKTPLQSGYFKFAAENEKRIFVVVQNKSLKPTDNVTKTFAVNENTGFVLIEVHSSAKVPVSSLLNPGGKVYKASLPEERILYVQSGDGKRGYWSVLSPTAGNWSVSLESPGEKDTIIVYSQKKTREFKFSMKQTGTNLSLTWNVAQVDSGQTVSIFLDTDKSGYDGFRVAKSDAKTGSLNFNLNESFASCNYYLYALLSDEFSSSQTYADEIINNPFSALNPPGRFTSSYNSGTGEVKFTWDPVSSSVAEGYILNITNESGKDSVYAILNKNSTGASLFIENYKTKTAKIESYSNDGKIGCPSPSIGLSTGGLDASERKEPGQKLLLFPNPTTGNCIIRYFVAADLQCDISVRDINGREIAHPVSGRRPAGVHQQNWDFGSIPNGVYLIVLQTGDQISVAKCILNR